MAKEKIEKTFAKLKAEFGGERSNSFAISKEQIRGILVVIGCDTDLAVDAIYALLDDAIATFKGQTFLSGATAVQIACHVGILQRGKRKVEPEGRDDWIRPLKEVGAIEPVTFSSETETFIVGHKRAKSPNAAYRLSGSFVELLKAARSTPSIGRLVAEWGSVDAIRTRLGSHAKAAVEQHLSHDGGRDRLIEDVKNHYVAAFLPEYEVLPVVATGGDPLGRDANVRLREVGIVLRLEEAYPDVMLVQVSSRRLWCVQAATSDGEVDAHKVEGVRRLCERSGLTLAGMTTAYPTWKDAARRQSRHKNLAVGAYLWIQEDPAKHWLAIPAAPKKRR